MKKIVNFMLIVIILLSLSACGNGENHTGEVKIPMDSSSVKGEDYKAVEEDFEKSGFTNIKFETIDDLIIGFLVKEGEVENVSVGGNREYSSDTWVPADTEVIIRYHVFPNKESTTTEQSKEEAPAESSGAVEETYPEEIIEDTESDDMEDTESESDVAEEILTAENCEELAKILSMNASICDEYIDFAEKYKDRTIEFDGHIDYLMNYEDYKTRYDILLTAGDYDPDSQIGPAFKFENVGISELHLQGEAFENEIKVGQSVRIRAKVNNFNQKSELFFLDPVSLTER